MAGSVFRGKLFRSNVYGICIGLTVGVVGKTIFDRINHLDETDYFKDGPATESSMPEFANLEQKYGLPKQFPILSYSNHVIGYDMSRKTPKWVIQHINKDILNGQAERKTCSFKRDSNVPEVFSATNEDYLKSGYSRGHMASAGDNRSDQKSMEETFYLTNIVPQNFQNNSGFWFRMESYCRKLAKQYNNIYIISGPLYLPYFDEIDGKKYVKYQVIGSREVAVPTHLYKVILVEKNDKPSALGVFIIPNQPIPNEKQLKDFIFPLEYLEEKLGHKLFPKLNKLSIPHLCKIESCKLLSKEEIELKIHNKQKLNTERRIPN